MADLFISYSRKDAGFVRVLHDALDRSNYTTWVDWADIPITADWWAEIQRGIEAADTFLFVISPDAIESRVCREEVEHADRHNKRMVPIVRREGFNPVFMHEGLSRHNWLMFREQDDFNEAFETLITAINLNLPYVRTHTRLLTRALEWDQHQRQDDFLLRGQDLQAAEDWLAQSEAQEPSVAELHRIFITKSRQVETANQRLMAAAQRARTLVRTGAGVLGLTLVAAIGTGGLLTQAYRQLHQSQIQALVDQSQARFQDSNTATPALVLALQAGDQFQRTRLIQGRAVLQQRIQDALTQALDRIAEYDQLAGHSDDVLDVAPSPDGQFYVTVGMDRQAILWDADGNEIRRIEGQSDVVRTVRYHPDGQTFATASDDGTVQIWDAEGSLVRQFAAHADWIYSLDFSPDGQTLATASADGTVKRWTLSGETLQTLAADAAGVRSVRFSPDGQTFATGGHSGIVRLWDAQGNLLGERRGHQNEITQLAFFPGSPQPAQPALASASIDGTVMIWSLEGENALQTLTNDRFDALWGLDIDAQGQTIAAAGQAGDLYLWHLDAPNTPLRLTGHQDRITAVHFGPDGHLVTASDDNLVKLWRWPHPALQVWPGDGHPLYAVAGQPPDAWATGGASGIVRRWTGAEFPPSGEDRPLGIPQSQIFALAQHPNGTLAVGTSTGEVQIWLPGVEVPQSFKVSDLSLRDLAFSPDGQTLATASDDGRVHLWPTEGPWDQPLVSLSVSPAVVYGLAFSPDGQTLATADDGGNIHLWTLAGEPLQTLPRLGSALYNLAFSPDGRWLATVGEDGRGRLWPLRQGQLQPQSTELIGHTAPIWGLAISPDGQTLATVSDDRTLRLWGWNGRPIATLGGFAGAVNAVTLSADGQRVIAVDSAGHTTLWHLSNADLSTLIDKGCRWFDDRQGQPRLPDLVPLCSPPP
ncbi:MAG: TIR domain-containing protein [Spirulina sp.]